MSFVSLDPAHFGPSISPPRCFQPSTLVDIWFFCHRKGVTGRLPALESKCGSARSGQLGWTTWHFGQLGFLCQVGNWRWWKMTWASPVFFMMFLLSHLETLRTCFWKNFQCANCIKDFIHRTSQSTSGPVVMALTFPTKQLASRHETQHQRCKNHTYEERLMGSSRQNKNVGFLKVSVAVFFFVKMTETENRSTKIRVKMSLHSKGDGFWNKFLLLPNAICYWWNDLHHPHVWLHGCVERLKCSATWDAKNGFRNIQAAH